MSKVSASHWLYGAQVPMSSELPWLKMHSSFVSVYTMRALQRCCVSLMVGGIVCWTVGVNSRMHIAAPVQACTVSHCVAAYPQGGGLKAMCWRPVSRMLAATVPIADGARALYTLLLRAH